MNVFEIACKLIDVESITPNERRIGAFLHGCLLGLAEETGGQVECMQAEPGRHNVFAPWGNPVVTLSTHMDTVPPYFPSREDDENIWGRGACDTKGIIASMMVAARSYWRRVPGTSVCCSWLARSAIQAGAYPRGEEPARVEVGSSSTASRPKTNWQSAPKARCGSKSTRKAGWPTRRIRSWETRRSRNAGRPRDARRIPLPYDAILGQSTLNIGTIHGGRAPTSFRIKRGRAFHSPRR